MLTTTRLIYHLSLSVSGLLLVSGCAVYAPTVPSTPQVLPGQVEVSAGLRNLTAAELNAAWSPRPHLLLTTEAAWQARSSGRQTNSAGQQTMYSDYHRQLGVGVGYYRAPTATSPLYWAAVGGLGWASTSLHDVSVGIASPFVPLPFPYASGVYEARYRRYYGQLYLARPAGESQQTGVSVRASWVDYTRLQLDGQPIAPASRCFLEPTLFMRRELGAFFLQGTLGVSVPLGRTNDPDRGTTAPISSLLGLSLGLRPHLLGAQAH